MSTSTVGRLLGRSLFAGRLGALLIAGAAALTAGCDGGTPPPPAGAGPNTGPAAVPTQPGASGPLGNMNANPTSRLGKSAQMGKDTAQMAINRDAAASAMADEISGLANPLVVAGLRWSVPSDWEVVRSGSAMRAAEYRIPHPEGGEGEAQIIWFYFGPGQGGTVADNITRWASLVIDPSGNATMPDIATMKINGIDATLVAMEGTYRDGIPGQTYVERPGYHFRGAIFEGPKGNVFIRLTGPADVMQALEEAWQQLFQGTRPENM